MIIIHNLMKCCTFQQHQHQTDWLAVDIPRYLKKHLICLSCTSNPMDKTINLKISIPSASISRVSAEVNVSVMVSAMRCIMCVHHTLKNVVMSFVFWILVEKISFLVLCTLMVMSLKIINYVFKWGACHLQFAMDNW